MGTRRAHLRPVSPGLVIGLILMFGGLGCCGWVAYQYVGTTLVSQHAFSSEKQQLRQRWSAAARRPGSPHHNKGRTQPNAAAAAPVIPGDALALLRIPALGHGYEVPIVAGTQTKALARGVGHYTSTAMPGQVGNFALAGHRITHGQPFAHLLDLDKGDQVVVETQQSIFTYVLDAAPRDLTVKAADGWVLDPVPGQPTATPTRALLTLTTCQDLFHSSDRSVGFGHLTHTTTKT